MNSHDIDIAALKDTLNHGDSEEKVNRREFEDVRNELEEL